MITVSFKIEQRTDHTGTRLEVSTRGIGNEVASLEATFADLAIEAVRAALQKAGAEAGCTIAAAKSYAVAERIALTAPRISSFTTGKEIAP